MATKKRRRRSQPIETAVAAAASQADARATDAASLGMKLLRDAAERKAGVAPGLLQGNLFEYIEWTKLSVDAARKGINIVGGITAAQGLHTAPADVVISLRGADAAFQLKSWGGMRALATCLSQPKYDGMGLVVPRDQMVALRDTLRAIAEERPADAARLEDVARRLRPSLAAGGASSEGSTRAELRGAAEHPDRYATFFELRLVAREVVVAGAVGAATGALVRAAVETAKGIVDVHRGKANASEVRARVGAAAVAGGKRGALAGATTTVVRYTATKLGMQTLAKSNVAAAVANCSLDVGAAVLDYVRGDASAEEAAERIGTASGSTLASVYAGAAGGVFFGPAGVLVGGIAGFMLGSQIIQSCVALKKHARLKENEAAAVEALAREATLVLAEQRRWVEAEALPRLATVSADLRAAFSAADKALADGDVDVLTLELAVVADVFGQSLQFATFAEFDAFMRTEEPLRLSSK